MSYLKHFNVNNLNFQQIQDTINYVTKVSEYNLQNKNKLKKLNINLYPVTCTKNTKNEIKITKNEIVEKFASLSDQLLDDLFDYQYERTIMNKMMTDWY